MKDRSSISEKYPSKNFLGQTPYFLMNLTSFSVSIVTETTELRQVGLFEAILMKYYYSLLNIRTLNETYQNGSMYTYVRQRRLRNTR
jgi:hypothetical protein